MTFVRVAGLLLSVVWWAGSAFSAPPPPAQFSFDDFLLAPLRVHLLSAANAPDWQTTLTEPDITRILAKVNGVWAQAGVHFFLESLVREEAESQEHYDEFKPQAHLQWLPHLRPEASRAGRMFHVYYVKELPVNGIHFPESNFVKDTATLREVPGGIDEPLPRVTAHELGHALSLQHRQNETNLLASRTTGTRLNHEEIQQARAAAKKLDWIQPAPALLELADGFARSNQWAEARLLYQRLAALPAESEAVARARKLSAR